MTSLDSAVFNGAWPLFAVGVFLLAGLVKGVVGLGLPTVAIALLSLVMTPTEAIALLVVPSLVTNIWQMRPWRSLGPLVRRLATMQMGVVVGTVSGILLFGAPAGPVGMLLLGTALIAYAVIGLAAIRLNVPSGLERWLGPLAGLLTGLVTAATGVFVVPAVLYLQGLRLQSAELIQAMGISFTVSTVATALALALAGRYPEAAATSSLLMVLPALAGMYLGDRLRNMMSPPVFRRCFFGGLLLLGFHLIWKSLPEL